MAPRTILHTGKGGAGKTALAVATARRCAAAGRRTLLLSIDGTRDLTHLLGTDLTDVPTAAASLLWVAESPGADALAALPALRAHHDSGAFDVLVVDCPATEQALRMLALPAIASRWLARTPPAEEDAQRVLRETIAAGELLRDHERVSARVVCSADPLALAHARRALTCLGLFGVLADAVLARGDGDLPDFGPVPVVRDLDALPDPAAMLRERVPQELTLGPGGAELRLDLPFVRLDEVSLEKAGLELLVRAGGHERAVALPPPLAEHRRAGTTLEDGELRVRFEAAVDRPE